VKNIGLYPRVQAVTDGTSVVSQAGGVVLVEAAHGTPPGSGVVGGVVAVA
jgi:hypothetical protein